jgi:3-dehydroquinate dehydratase type I
MRRSWRSEDRERICIPITETTGKGAIKAIKEAIWFPGLIELRMDYLREPGWVGRLLRGRQKPFIVTNRRKEEGGKCRVDERSRVGVLEEAIELGAEFVDVEFGTEESLLRRLIAHRKRTKVVLSSHDFEGTPSQRKLKDLYERMVRWKPDLVKITTFARSWEDNFRTLSLIPDALKEDQKIVAFCMGEKGKMSRIFSPMMGAAWTYTSLGKNRASAPGQLTVLEMMDIWDKLR